MRTISQREFQDNASAVIAVVEAGETVHVTRDGVAVVEVRPIARRRRVSARELVERHRRLPRTDLAAARAEADAYFGDEDRIDEDTRPDGKGVDGSGASC
ncbi:type II toxin-antitoxin system Phd/YefM family antitoxin [Nocardiopsis sp. NPDC050513]|uniref:type II toxin-antitoxin system Phd/YefM family antitoxin n=1 Tax=Nocardiopsis sp. NPDC050513 TaxID=3364338 RepID=UPI0037B96243